MGRASLLLAIVLLLPVVAASHAPPPSAADRLSAGETLEIDVIQSGATKGTLDDSSDQNSGSYEYTSSEQYSFQHSWNWSLGATLTPDGQGGYSGEGSAEFSSRFKLSDDTHAESISHTGKSAGQTVAITTTHVDCSGETTYGPTGQMLAGTVDAIRIGNSLKVTVHSLGRVPMRGVSCARQQHSEGFGGSGAADTASSFQPWPGTDVQLADDTRMGGAGGDVVFTVPLDRPRTTFDLHDSGNLSRNAAPPAGVACVPPAGEAKLQGTCAWGGTMEVRVFVGYCQWSRKDRDEHVALLHKLGDPPATSQQGVLDWASRASALVRDVLTDERRLTLACADEGDENVVTQTALKIAHALAEVEKHDGLDATGVRALLGADRILELHGIDDPEGSAAFDHAAARLGSPRPSGTITVSVHSPVSLVALDEKGQRVDATASGIPGATYNGTPGREQTLTLPAGFYKIALEGVAPGSVLLNVSWASTDGGHGTEEYLLDAAPGQTTSTHVSLDPDVDTGKPALQDYPASRGPTAQALAFADAPAPAGESAPPVVSGAPSPSDGPPPSPPTKAAPGAPWALVLAVVAVAARLRHR